MLKHIVFWTLKAEGRESALAEMKSRLESLEGLVPGMLAFEVGVDVGSTEQSADLVLYSEFESAEALQAYATHPDHLAVADFIAGVRESRMVADYEA